MARFYVLRGKKALWNLLIIAMVVLALVYIFRNDDLGDDEEVIANNGPSLENLVVVEPVTVRSVPTKFAEYKLERERMRSRQLELLQNFAYDTHSDSQRREQFQNELQALVRKMGRETEIENLLKAQGYVDGLVILDDGAVTVVVPITLTREEAARIGDVVHRLTGINFERITIVDETLGV